ncbi:hypothetical protein [Vibrio gallaecicus]|nr:hypothetical protein [Vibrio gallaecicus]MDN3617208.1 hypothetical protein [Vibrio gallaecicus]
MNKPPLKVTRRCSQNKPKLIPYNYLYQVHNILYEYLNMTCNYYKAHQLI